MSNRSRLIIAAASLLMLVMYVTPLWRITLEAPQYPEGLGLKIMLDTVEGQNEFDLGKINNLNHYIGMQQIEPEAIPELKIMPWAIAFLIVMGLGVAYTGNRKLLYTWTGLFVLLAIAGMIDFYLWEYDYGHNLDLENAAIKIPGMSYQPPLIGSKQLLNFTAHSWPGIGGWIAIASCMTSVLVAVTTFRNRRKQSASTVTGGTLAVASVALLIGLTGCSKEPAPYHLGVDQGEYCRMTIMDARFAAQIVTPTGKAIKFDSIECMLGYLETHPDVAENATAWVSDYLNPDTILPAEDAVFMRSMDIRSPMGAGLAAFTSTEKALGDTNLTPAADGPPTMTWAELRKSHHSTSHA